MIITFIGHANLCITHQLKEQICHTLETKICPHNTTFYCGGYGAFDNICAHIVNELKVAHPHIRAVFVSPYRNQARLQTAKESGLYDDILFAGVEKAPYHIAIIKRNEYMVDKADFIVVYVDHAWGGAYRTFLYAQKQKKCMINLAEKQP